MEFLQVQTGGRDPMPELETAGEKLRAVRGRHSGQNEEFRSVGREIEVTRFIDEDVERRHGGGV
jgi:hypothetical protein